jgi:opacity protein-like surface antigen
MKRFAIAAAAALAMLGTAHAQQFQSSNAYGELGYTFLTYKADNFKASPGALRGIFGYNFHPYFAGEAMLGFGTTNDSDQGVTVKPREMFGLYLKPKYDFGNLQAFARLGYAHISTRVSGFGVSDTSSDNDFSWGVGVNYSFNPKMYVGADWMQYNNKDGGKIEGLTISFGYRF